MTELKSFLGLKKILSQILIAAEFFVFPGAVTLFI